MVRLYYPHFFTFINPAAAPYLFIYRAAGHLSAAAGRLFFLGSECSLLRKSECSEYSENSEFSDEVAGQFC